MKLDNPSAKVLFLEIGIRETKKHFAELKIHFFLPKKMRCTCPFLK